MILERVTLTGADTNTNPERLYELASEYPFVELAFLFSWSRMGTERYPTIEWLDDYCSRDSSEQLALHLCGNAVNDYVLGHNIIDSIVSQFGRVQLNFNLARMSPDFHELVRSRIYSVDPMIDPVIITQHNVNNIPIYLTRDQTRPHHFLFDSSGGNGLRPGEWPQPLERVTLCGYAGGLGPDTLERDLESLSKVVGNGECWIDMESNIRTDGLFDFDKCIKVLEIAKQFVR